MTPVLLFLFYFLISSNLISTYKIVIEKPSANSVFQANDNCLIRWTSFDAEPYFSHVDIQLAFSTPDSHTIVSTIAHNFDVTHTHFLRFITPKRSFSEGNYFIIFKAVGVDYETYSPIFKIVSGSSP